MMRPIDADALKKSLTLPEESGRMGELLTMIIHSVIDSMPTIERKKGKWISLDDFRGKYNDYGYKCSECGEHSDYEANFCPNCGARMVQEGE